MKDITEIRDFENRKAENKFKHLLEYSVSHELKTPLNGLVNFLEGIENEGNDESK